MSILIVLGCLILFGIVAVAVRGYFDDRPDVSASDFGLTEGDGSPIDLSSLFGDSGGDDGGGDGGSD